MVCYHSGKSHIDANALSCIPLDQNIKAEEDKAIFHAAVKGSNALMEVYACHERAISSLILKSPPTQMTVADWVQAQKGGPGIKQIITWLEDKLLGTVKVGKEMSPELRQCLRQKGQLYLQDGVLYRCGSCTNQDGNEFQLVVPPDYRLEAMCMAHDDVGHLGLRRMLDILGNRFCWPNLEADATHCVCTCEWCQRLKSKQDKTEFCPFLVTYPLELVHMDFLTIENPHTGADVNVLVITDHFTQ